jgi:Immunity protein 71/Immunity protein 72
MKPYEQIPTDIERSKIFYHLKKCSSYSAWNRLVPYYKVWSEILEKSVAEAGDNATPEKPPYLETQELIFVLKGLSTFEKCVQHLYRGDKSPFRFNGTTCFAVAHHPLGFWSQIWGRGEVFSEAMNNPDIVPYWNEILKAYGDLAKAWSEIGGNILQTESSDDCAVFTFGGSDREFYFGGKAYQNDLGENFSPYHFPTNLPEVPDPEEVVLIGYGDYVPCSGIWEPVKTEVPKRKLVSMFSKPEMPSGPFEVVGSMNYLHGNTTAPHIGEGREIIATIWRLLWKDDRYLDGTIPAEEAGYVFNEPRKTSAAKDIVAAKVGDAVIFAHTGERAIKAGVWAVQEDLQARQTFAAGDTLPQHNHRDVTWVWTEA